MSKSISPVESLNDPKREIVNTREFSASREAMFNAFADPKRLAQWWGPNGFTNTIHEFDLQPGGKWRLTMHGPGGADYQNESVFTAVEQPTRIVFDHLEPVHRFRMIMTFAERDGKTTLTWRMRFDDAGEFAKLKTFIQDANEQNFDRLAAHLAKTN